MRETAASESSSQVKVLFFSALRDLVGQSELSCPLPSPATAGELWKDLKKKYEGLNAWDERILIAVNLDFASLQTPLAHGDEVAFMPPVQGG